MDEVEGLLLYKVMYKVRKAMMMMMMMKDDRPNVKVAYSD